MYRLRSVTGINKKMYNEQVNEGEAYCTKKIRNSMQIL